MKEGDVLDFCRVVPTFADRRAFYMGVLCMTSKDPRPTLISKCKEYFSQRVKEHCRSGEVL